MWYNNYKLPIIVNLNFIEYLLNTLVDNKDKIIEMKLNKDVEY